MTNMWAIFLRSSTPPLLTPVNAVSSAWEPVSEAR